ncbi:hypothetical protein L3Q82_016299 [Scortum barcoo]|uniref:Uncharacterized protein n=1 Tax=Scortum barcoo TaxID=214431 RepID=A0ACB8VQM5_9TELE|nr:hypothetical protein L3Q82_016299 [Scortum barcoo]
MGRRIKGEERGERRKGRRKDTQSLIVLEKYSLADGDWLRSGQVSQHVVTCGLEKSPCWCVQGRSVIWDDCSSASHQTENVLSGISHTFTDRAQTNRDQHRPAGTRSDQQGPTDQHRPTGTNTDQQGPGQTSRDQVRPAETNRTNTDQQQGPTQTSRDQVRPAETNRDQVRHRPAGTRSDQQGPTQTSRDQVRPAGTNTEQQGPTQTNRPGDQHRPTGTRSDHRPTQTSRDQVRPAGTNTDQQGPGHRPAPGPGHTDQGTGTRSDQQGPTQTSRDQHRPTGTRSDQQGPTQTSRDQHRPTGTRSDLKTSSEREEEEEEEEEEEAASLNIEQVFSANIYNQTRPFPPICSHIGCTSGYSSLSFLRPSVRRSPRPSNRGQEKLQKSLYGKKKKPEEEPQMRDPSPWDGQTIAIDATCTEIIIISHIMELWT